MQRSIQVGFIDAEGENKERLIFNGNLFKRDSIAKTDAVVSSLSSADQSKVNEFSAILSSNGCVLATSADKILGDVLFEKLKAAGFFEVNIVSNEHGDHAFVNAPGAFHKFVNPLVDDCFDMAKALVSALTYGKSLRSASQGRIVNVAWILNALISKRLIGPATAIGNDYRVLEENRVVKLIPASAGMFYMQLLKTDVGVLALEVLSHGDANAESITTPLASPMTGYIGPERTRIQVRRNQKQASRRSTHDILSALRGGRRV